MRVMLLLGLFLVNCSFFKDTKPRARPDSFAVLLTTNWQGYIKPCGCTPDPLGGIDRLASAHDEISQNFSERIFWLDGGNLLFDSPKPRLKADACQDEARVDLLLSTFKKRDLLATLKGPMDDALGLNFAKQQFEKHQIQILDTNDTAGVVVKKGTITLGVVAFGSQEKLQAKVNQLRAKHVWAVVVLAQAPESLIKETMKNISGVDLVISGQDTGEQPKPPQPLEKGAWLVSAGMQGQYLGVTEWNPMGHKPPVSWVLDDRAFKNAERQSLLKIRAQFLKNQLKETKEDSRRDFIQSRLDALNKEVAELKLSEQNQKPLATPHWKIRFVKLSQAIKPEPKVHADIEAYEKKIPELTLKCEEDIECPKTKHNQAVYVGAETCKSCHAGAYEVWQKSRHAKAWKTLEDVHKTSDRSCIGCHSIGFLEAGGYCKVSQVDFRKNVQCESCHGPGSLHVKTSDKRFIRGKVTEGVCRSCHHVPHITSTESFVYEEKVQQILGEGHGSALLKQLKHLAR